MPERPDTPKKGDEGGGYAVPTQFPAPPDVTRSGRAWGPPEMPPDDPETVRRGGPPQAPPEDPRTSLWGPPGDMPPEPDRWGAAPVHRYGSTALLDRPSTRRPVVAAPVRPPPAAPSQQSWDWEKSHGLRNALIAAAAILLVGSLIAALVVFRGRDDPKQSFVEPPPATVTIAPIAPSEGTVASTAPVSLAPVTTPPTSAAPPPTTTTRPPAPPTTVRITTPTTRRPVTPTVTASPPIGGCPPACPTTATTRPRTTTSSSSTTLPTPG